MVLSVNFLEGLELLLSQPGEQWLDAEAGTSLSQATHGLEKGLGHLALLCSRPALGSPGFWLFGFSPLLPLYWLF